MHLEKIVKIILAFLFFLCLLDMPYGYYQLIRFIALIGFGVLAFKSHENKNQVLTIVFIGLALLFQPLIKISLGRSIWNVVDVIVGVGLVISVFVKQE